MISFDRARRQVLDHLKPLPRTRITLGESAGYVLAQKISARFDLPRFDQSAMDGFAVRIADLQGASEKSPVSLKLDGAIFAGDFSRRRVGVGTAVKIMTGAAVPPGADAVVMKEFCDESDDQVMVRQQVDPGRNVRYRGEEFKKGTIIQQPGVRITPPIVGLLADFGYARVMVNRRPKISLITTGSELVTPGQSLRRGQKYDSNSFAVAAAVRQLGLAVFSVQQIDDNRPRLQKALRAALAQSDVVITVGGVSVGDRDYVKDVLDELGVQTVFEKVAVKPGKPSYFGIFNRRKHRVSKSSTGSNSSAGFVFGLPGNPVSALVTFHQLVKPALLRLSGQQDVSPQKLTAELQKSCRKKKGRLEWKRGKLKTVNGNLTVWPTTGQESHMLGGLAEADCLIRFPVEETSLVKGASVVVELLQWDR